jgi:two-component system CheB/CheR fusion protein
MPDRDELTMNQVRGSAPLSFPIVGIGASAGGLEAFRRLLGNLPNDTGMAYVLIQHLDPSHDSMLADLLASSTQLDVSEVKSDVCVAPNRIYVIPPSKGLILVDGTLKLVPRSPVGSVPMPIDSFLRTLAEVQGSQAIGVILSGMGSDGTLGLQAIEEAGGITFAQEPSSARNEDMPRSAIRGGRIDFVLPPEGIAHELTRLGRHPYLGIQPSDPVSVDATPHALVGTEGKNDEEPDSLARVLELLRQASGTDFGGYRKATLRRRIARRMALSRIQTLKAYAAHLEGNATEAASLYEDCLISVTSFFRDPGAFEALSEQVHLLLSRDSPADEALRMWVPGCATGEEVYSLAMWVLERAAELSRNPSLQIFATDLSERALAKAREGSYPLNISRDVSAERLRRFFSKVGDQYQINKAVREMCVFARHDLTRDPPYSRMDLISCRNVLIYLEPPLQEMLFATFHYALRPEGLLMVGPAETVGNLSSFFSAVDEKHRIYSSQALDGPPRPLSVRRDVRPLGMGVHPPLVRKVSGTAEASREADRILLDRFGPAGVIVDSNLNVLEFRGDTDPFLDHSHGKASLNLEHLLRRGLLIDLRQALEEVRRTGAPAARRGLLVNYRRELRNVAVEVVLIKGRAIDAGCLFILFEMESLPAAGERRSSNPESIETAGIKDREIARLGQALAEATEYVHTLVREHESAVEDLQASTEEALSGNEELQSLNEELQTAKEEIQSANEELATLNQELSDRNLQLARFNDDIQLGLDNANALVNAVPQPFVILDTELRIEKANRAFYATFHMTPETTRDRLLAEIGGGQWSNPPLLTALKEVLASGTTVVDLEVDAEFPHIGFRNMFLNALSLHPRRGSRGCILLTIEDRTEVTRSERGREAVLTLEHDARERAEAADHLKDQFVATVSHELRGPLNVISGWMNILLAAGRSPDDAVLAKALAAIGRGVAAQTRLLSDLIDHSRIVTGKVELQRAAIDLWTVAEAAIVGVRAAADAKDISLILSGHRVTSVVLGDFDRMQQVLWNLFLNAVKFTPPGGGSTNFDRTRRQPGPHHGERQRPRYPRGLSATRLRAFPAGRGLE